MQKNQTNPNLTSFLTEGKLNIKQTSYPGLSGFKFWVLTTGLQHSGNFTVRGTPSQTREVTGLRRTEIIPKLNSQWGSGGC